MSSSLTSSARNRDDTPRTIGKVVCHEFNGGMGLLGVVTSLAMKNSAGFKSPMLHQIILEVEVVPPPIYSGMVGVV